MESSMRLPAATKRGATPPEAAALVQKLVEDQTQPIPVETRAALRKVADALSDMAKRESSDQGTKKERGAKR